jgi:hypothetical protein
MAKSDPTKDPEFKRVLGNLLSAPPKPHSRLSMPAHPRLNVTGMLASRSI